MTTVTGPKVGLVAVSRTYRLLGSWRLSRQGQSARVSSLACDPPSVGPLEDIGALALHHHGPALVVRDVRQQLRVAKPTIGHDQGLAASPSRGRAV